MFMSSSFSGFSSPHAVFILVSELSPRRGPSKYHGISPFTSDGAVAIIIVSVSMTSPSVSTTLALSHPLMSSKCHVPAYLTL